MEVFYKGVHGYRSSKWPFFALLEDIGIVARGGISTTWRGTTQGGLHHYF
jgi:hypothetical protein